MTDTGYFTEDNSAKVVAGRIADTTDPGFKVIQFLTATGHMCDDWRQEFVLLSDVLGVSMLVDAINNRKP